MTKLSDIKQQIKDEIGLVNRKIDELQAELDSLKSERTGLLEALQVVRTAVPDEPQ